LLDLNILFEIFYFVLKIHRSLEYGLFTSHGCLDDSFNIKLVMSVYFKNKLIGA